MALNFAHKAAANKDVNIIEENTVQPSRTTRSYRMVTVQPPVHSSLKITNCFFGMVHVHLTCLASFLLLFVFLISLVASSSPSSSPSSYSDPRPVVDISRGVFHSRLKTLFPQSLSPRSHLFLPQADLLALLVSATDLASPAFFWVHY